MNRTAILAIARRDLAAVRRNAGVLIPMIAVPLVLVAVFSAATYFSSRATVKLEELSYLVDMTAPGAVPEDAGVGVALATLLATYMAPPLLVIVALLTASVMATDSIAGERERGTIEGLLLAPVTDRDILLGKLLGALVPALVIGLAAQALYGAVAVAVLLPVTGTAVLPTLPWLVTVLWFGPSFTAATLGLTILVSARVKTVQAAYQVSGVGVLPLVALTVSQASGLFLLHWWIGLIAGAVLWGAAAVLVRMSARVLDRETQITTLA